VYVERRADGGVPLKSRIPEKLKAWVEARKRHRLSHAQVQMARELGMNPRALGKIDNHRQEPWKAPLPIFIEGRYLKRFGKALPDEVLSIEDWAARDELKKAAKKEAKQLRRAARQGEVGSDETTVRAVLPDGLPETDGG
jgi:hypothetical protein